MQYSKTVSLNNRANISTSRLIQENNEERKTTTLSFIKENTDRIRKVLRKHNIRTILDRQQKLSNSTGSPEQHIPNESAGIHETPCANRSKLYVGYMKRNVSDTKITHYVGEEWRQYISSSLT